MARKKDPKMYIASDYSKKEEQIHKLFDLQLEDARRYFMNVTKPRLDRAYKLYIAYTGDRQKEIKSWQSNIFVPYVQSVVETLMPRILDARPEFQVMGRTEEDHLKSQKQNMLAEYFWEVAKMDQTTEDFTRAALIFGTGYLQVSWKKDVRKQKFLKTKDVNKKTYEYKEEERTFYDAPYCEWVDNYNLWYDWHNTKREHKQYWFKRLILTEGELRRRYPMADEKRLQMAMHSGPGDLTDHASVRAEVKTTHDRISKGRQWTPTDATEKYNNADHSQMKLFEVFEWWRPFDDEYAVMVGQGHVPLFKGGSMPIPFDFKEAPFIETTYLKVPGEFEGYGLPLILENPQIMLNLIKNQRLDAATLNIHKMWIVNPLANINKNELVTRPFGIIYSIDPQGVREVQFSDVKSSAYQEEDRLKGDMRYSSGVDDFSMGVGGQGVSATEVRHLRESTLERVRLFVNHLGDAYADVLRYWMALSEQLMDKEMTIRIIGDNGEEQYPLIAKDDLKGMFDYRAKVLPSIAGMADVNKKQAMDLFQLISQIDPQSTGVDIRKLLQKVLGEWDWTLDSISTNPEEEGVTTGQEEMDPAMMEAMQQGGMMPQGPGGMEQMMQAGAPGGAPQPGAEGGAPVNQDMSRVLSMLRGPEEIPETGMGEQASGGGTNLLKTAGPPPTVPGVPPTGQGGPGPARKKTNPAGFSRNGKVNTNLSSGNNTTPEAQILNRSFNIQ